MDYTIKIIANNDFNEQVIKPIMAASLGVSDTSELFLRAYQLLGMFKDEKTPRIISFEKVSDKELIKSAPDDALAELKSVK